MRMENYHEESRIYEQFIHTRKVRVRKQITTQNLSHFSVEDVEHSMYSVFQASYGPGMHVTMTLCFRVILTNIYLSQHSQTKRIKLSKKNWYIERVEINKLR